MSSASPKEMPIAIATPRLESRVQGVQQTSFFSGVLERAGIGQRPIIDHTGQATPERAGQVTKNEYGPGESCKKICCRNKRYALTIV